MGRQLDRPMSFWQPASMLNSVVILILLWQINIDDVVDKNKTYVLWNASICLITEILYKKLLPTQKFH